MRIILFTYYSDAETYSVRLECDRHGQSNMNCIGAAREITVLCEELPSDWLRYRN